MDYIVSSRLGGAEVRVVYTRGERLRVCDCAWRTGIRSRWTFHLRVSLCPR